MDKYAIYCTESQTRKALELGAPIIQSPEWELDSNLKLKKGKYTTLVNPTAEQMIGWLEEHKLQIVITAASTDRWIPIVYETSSSHPLYIGENADSRVNATLAAIDAALEYLSHGNCN